MAEEKKKYRALTLVVGKARAALADKVDALAKRLNCRKSDLVWSAIETLVATPPKVAPEGASPRVGTAAGFWVVHDRDKANKLSAVRLVEVDERADAEGKMFFRYKRDDKKSRERALRSAQKAAAYDAELVGLSIPAKGYAPTKQKGK